MNGVVQRARALADAGRFADAQVLCEQVLQVQPLDFEALHVLGCVKASTGHDVQAMALVECALDVMPWHGPFWFTLGLLLEQQGRAEDAAQAFGRCLDLMPRHPQAAESLARLLCRQGRWAELMSFCEASRQKGQQIRGLAVLNAMALVALQRADEATAWFEAAEQHDPWLLAPRYQHACVLLAQGRYQQGWERYEDRVSAGPRFGQGFATLNVPRWTGQSLQGKTVLVHREQTLEAQVLLASMLMDLKARGASVILDVGAALQPLFAHAFPRIRMVDLAQANAAVPARPLQVDYEVPLGSLGRVVRPHLQAFTRGAYLRVAADRRKLWKARMGKGAAADGRRLRVGIVAATDHASCPGLIPFDSTRDTVPLASFAPLAMAGVELVLLGQDVPSAATAFDVTAFPGQQAELMDVAALAERLDLVVGIDSPAVHVAAALGKEVWVLASPSAAWWWGSEGSACPWYASVRTFRRAGDDWQPAIDAVAHALTLRTQQMKAA